VISPLEVDVNRTYIDREILLSTRLNRKLIISSPSHAGDVSFRMFHLVYAVFVSLCGLSGENKIRSLQDCYEERATMLPPFSDLSRVLLLERCYLIVLLGHVATARHNP
jgi:hypothetical protein